MFRNAFSVIHQTGEQGIDLREMSQALHPLGILSNKYFFLVFVEVNYYIKLYLFAWYSSFVLFYPLQACSLSR